MAETGHGKIYLVTDLVEKLHDPNFKPSYGDDLSAYPKAYHYRKGDFLNINNALPLTKPLIRSNFHETHNRFCGYAGKSTGQPGAYY